MRLKNKHILIGITGSIAAYKMPEFIRMLQQEGASVQVMVTPAALEFVTTVTLEALTGYPVLKDLFHDQVSMPHIQSARKADLILVAPASANTLAKLAYGLADDVVATTVLASKVSVLIAPAMNVQMWNNPLVQENVEKLKQVYQLIDPDAGYLACGEYGQGRLVDLEILKHEIIRALTSQDLKGKKVLINLGATREYLDPVRFLANASSGKMGFALVQEAYYRGAEVTAIVGAVEEQCSLSLQFIQIKTTEEMEQAVLRELKTNDIFIAAAAVADYQFVSTASTKLKKGKADLSLKLKPTPDILQQVLQLKSKVFVVGFALESNLSSRLITQKFKSKPVDLLVCNSVEALGADQAKVIFVSSQGHRSWSVLSKEDISKNIFNHIVKSF